MLRVEGRLALFCSDHTNQAKSHRRYV